MGRVEGKVVAITGAARGQGRSHAVRLAEEGADIIAIDVCDDVSVVEYPASTPEELAETALLVEKTGRRVVTKQVDVRDRAAMKRAIDEGVDELGRLDVVIPNAGILPLGDHHSAEAYTDTVDVNLGGVFNTVHAALPHLEAGASIIVIGSVASFQPGHGDTGAGGPGFAGYRFAKHTLVEYVNSMAMQLASSGRRINAVHPTNVDTAMVLNDRLYRTFRQDLENPTKEDAEPVLTAINAMPVPYISPAEVSHAIVYLASDESRYATGTHLKIDAGSLVKQDL